MPTIRITVAKKMSNPELYAKYGKTMTPVCDLLEEGAVFLSRDYYMPEGFCPWAWADIHREIITLAMGGEYPWSSQPGTAVACCSDGLRPVVFVLERVE